MLNPRVAFERTYGRSERPSPNDEQGGEETQPPPPRHPAFWPWARYVSRMLAALFAASVLWLGAAFTIDGGPVILLFGLLPGVSCALGAALLWRWDEWMSLDHPGVVAVVGGAVLAFGIVGLTRMVIDNLPDTHPVALVVANWAFLGLLAAALAWQAGVAWRQSTGSNTSTDDHGTHASSDRS
jgi:hypothetical protein